MVADSFEDAEVSWDENVEAELGVVELGGLEAGVFGRVLSIESPSRGFGGRPRAGAAEAGSARS